MNLKIFPLGQKHTQHQAVKSGLLAAVLTLMGACAIENDIPYPLVEGAIEAIEVEGQCDEAGLSSNQATIHKKDLTVRLYVDDTVDLSRLRITRLGVTNDATLIPLDDSQCLNRENFPDKGFSGINQLPDAADTRMDFSRPVSINLRTYQDYVWTIDVQQVVRREILLKNQIGQAAIDPINRKAVIYVTPDQPLDKIEVTTFDLGGPHGKVVPDPTESATYDFSQPCTFFVQHGWEEFSYQWEVFVYQKEADDHQSQQVFPMSTRAIVSGSFIASKALSVEYKRDRDTDWKELDRSYLQTQGTRYTATLPHLRPATTYQCRILVNRQPGEPVTFTTAGAPELTDGSLDNWHQDGKLLNPWAPGSTSFWDTGNRGATTISESNSVPTDDTCNGQGKAALLESKYLVMKFASGNLFTGSYLKTTGTNGILSFGRPFTAFPTKLRFYYKYHSEPITKIGEDKLNYLKGRPDSCHVYVALTDWDEPREIRTRPSERQLFDFNDPKIIAYAELIQGSDVNSYQEIVLPLEYRSLNRTPKFIAVIATASKYGDYFTGGVGTKLWLDNFELIYD